MLLECSRVSKEIIMVIMRCRVHEMSTFCMQIIQASYDRFQWSHNSRATARVLNEISLILTQIGYANKTPLLGSETRKNHNNPYTKFKILINCICD